MLNEIFNFDLSESDVCKLVKLLIRFFNNALKIFLCNFTIGKFLIDFILSFYMIIFFAKLNNLFFFILHFLN